MAESRVSVFGIAPFGCFPVLFGISLVGFTSGIEGVVVTSADEDDGSAPGEGRVLGGGSSGGVGAADDFSERCGAVEGPGSELSISSPKIT